MIWRAAMNIPQTYNFHDIALGDSSKNPLNRIMQSCHDARVCGQTSFSYIAPACHRTPEKARHRKYFINPELDTI